MLSSVRRMPSRKDEDGVVRSALKPRCIACSNCVLACPFGVPKVHHRAGTDDEVRHVLRPHFGRAEAHVRDCMPSQALSYGPPDAIARRRRSVPVRDFRFGNEHVRTKVFIMMPEEHPVLDVDIEDYMWREPDEQAERWVVDQAVFS